MSQIRYAVWKLTMAVAGLGWVCPISLLLTGGLCCLLFTPCQAQDQPLTESDKREIKRQALIRISKDFPLVINTLTSDDNTEADIRLMILNSYLPNQAGQQVFVNDEVLLEDDVDPTHTGAATKVDKPVRQYLSDVVSFYPKNTDRESPSFVVTSVVLDNVIDESATSARIAVYYSSRFRGKNKAGKAYQTVNRVATLQATRVNKKWEVYIRQILFVRPGAGLAQTTPTAPLPATVAAPVALPPVDIKEPMVVYRQADYEFNATIRANKQALDVVKTESPRLPLGQYHAADDGSYVLDGNRITFNGKDRAAFTFTNRDRDLLGFSRVEPAKPAAPLVAMVAVAAETPKAVALAPPKTPVKPAPEAIRLPEPKPLVVQQSAPVVVQQAKPIADKPAPALAKMPTPKLPKPVVQKPMAMSVSPDLKKSLNSEQRRIMAAMRLRGWLQVVGGLAALGGSYVAYSGIKKDYDAYQVRAGAATADYTIYRELTQRPMPPGGEPLSMTAYGSPTIYGVYGGGVAGIGLTINGIRTLFRAGKINKKK